MATIGELNDFGVVDLIDLLTRRRRSGRLAVKVGGQEVSLFFERGALRHVTSTDITLRLGRMLVRQGIIDTPQLLEALHLQAETDGQAGAKRPLGAILIERGWITHADLDRCLEDQSIEVLSRAMTDENGMFVFDVGVSPTLPPEARPLNALTLLQYAQERSEALVKLRERLPAPSAPLFLAASAFDDPSLADSLSAPEVMVVHVLRGGPRSFGELTSHLALDELSLGVAVITLLAGGTIVTAGQAAASPKPTAPRPSSRYATADR